MSEFPKVFKDDLDREVKVCKSPEEYTVFYYWGNTDMIKLIVDHSPYGTRLSVYGKKGWVGSLENGSFNLFSSSDNFYIRNNRIKFKTRKELMDDWRNKLSKT